MLLVYLSNRQVPQRAKPTVGQALQLTAAAASVVTELAGISMQVATERPA